MFYFLMSSLMPCTLEKPLIQTKHKKPLSILRFPTIHQKKKTSFQVAMDEHHRGESLRMPDNIKTVEQFTAFIEQHNE